MGFKNLESRRTKNQKKKSEKKSEKNPKKCEKKCDKNPTKSEKIRKNWDRKKYNLKKTALHNKEQSVP